MGVVVVVVVVFAVGVVDSLMSVGDLCRLAVNFQSPGPERQARLHGSRCRRINVYCCCDCCVNVFHMLKKHAGTYYHMSTCVSQLRI